MRSAASGAVERLGLRQHSAHHRALDEWFLTRHPPVPTDVVVDLGCGGGEFSARLASLVPDGRVIGIDRDASMLASARRHEAANLTFLRAAAEQVDEIVIPEDGIRTVAQRRPFDREALVGLLRTQAGLAVTRHAPEDSAEALLHAVSSKVDELRRADGSYDQTFVRLEILARRPG